MEKKITAIPFNKPARVGNFKLWRTNFMLEFMPSRDMLSEEDQVRLDKGEIKLKKQRTSIECINISNLDGSWMTRIPQTWEMYGMLTLAWQWYNGDNEDEKKRGKDYFTTVLSNMAFCGSISNEYYHQALMMIATAYAYPVLLSDKKKFKDFSKEAENLIKDFLSWRKDFDKRVNRPLTEEEQRQEEAAQQIMEEMEKQQENDEGTKG